MVTLTIHVVVIGGLLLQGCKDTTAKDKKAPGAPAVGKVMAHAHSLTP
jgi:outer membrane murein-binding lipoprotein Lpp